MLNLKIEPVERVLGSGFDYKLNRDDFISIYKESKIGTGIISQQNSFSKHECKAFISGLLTSPYECSISSDNIQFIKLVNKRLRSKNKNKRILVVDNHNFFHRSFHAYPSLNDSNGNDTAVLKALANFLKWLTQTQERYTHIIFASEGGRLKRKDFYPEYKASRKETDSGLENQIALCESFLTRLGYTVLKIDGYEADDVLASIVDKAYQRGIPVTAFTSDKDAFQLGVYPGFEIMDSKKEVFNANELLMEKYSMTPENFISYQAIVGDTADNVPGGKGLGDVTAKELINTFQTLDNIFENIDNLWISPDMSKKQIESAKKKQLKFLEQKDNILLSKELVTLKTGLLEDILFQDSPMPFRNYSSILKQEFSKFDIVF